MNEPGHTPKKVTIYIDGACIGNPGPGGYGLILICGPHRKELAGGFRLTTNNRMELMPAIVGLQALKFNCTVTIYSDSRYLVDSMNKGWVYRWQANGWAEGGAKQRPNADLWQQLLQACQRHDVEFVWLKAHSGHPENERADLLATEAARQQSLAIDTGYEEDSADEQEDEPQLQLALF